MALGSMGLAGSAEAVPPATPLSVHLECQRRATPGRVLCEAELEVNQGRLVWGDVLVLEAPAFAPPLRARVGPGGALMKTEQRERLQMALAATRVGQGHLIVRARGVLCPDASGDGCRALVAEADTVVAVGPITD
jgi:hypothetical protein